MVRSTSSKVFKPQTTNKCKKIKKVKENLENQVFSLKKYSDQKQVKVIFPTYKFPNGQSQLMIPLYRTDKSFLGFSLFDEINEEELKKQHKNHQYMVERQMLDLTPTKMKPLQPNKGSNYCTICKVRYNQYQSHVKESQHLRRLDNSPSIHFIRDLCIKYALGSKKYQSFDEQQTNIDMDDRRFFIEKRRTSEQQKQKLYEQIQEEFKKNQTKKLTMESEEIFDVII